MGTIIFVVGAQVKQIVDSTKPDQPLLDAVVDLIGVFDTEEAALAACTQRHHFIGTLTLNERLPDAREVWPGAYFPKTKGGAMESKTNTNRIATGRDRDALKQA